MSLEFISSLFRSPDFGSFEMFLAEGRTFAVQNPELVMIGPDSRSLSIFTPPATTENIDLDLIVSIRFDEAQP